MRNAIRCRKSKFFCFIVVYSSPSLCISVSRLLVALHVFNDFKPWRQRHRMREREKDDVGKKKTLFVPHLTLLESRFIRKQRESNGCWDEKEDIGNAIHEEVKNSTWF